MVLLEPRNKSEFVAQVSALQKPPAIIFTGMHEETERTTHIAST